MTDAPAFSTAAMAARDAPATSRFEFGREIALGEQADTVPGMADNAGLYQLSAGDRLIAFQQSTFDRGLNSAEIDRRNFSAKWL